MSGPVRFVDAPPVEVCEALVFMLGWATGRVPVFVDGAASPAFRVAGGTELWERAHALDLDRSAEVTVGLPAGRGGVVEGTVVWAFVRGKDQLERAARFRPAPSMVLRFGSSTGRLLLWSLREPVPGVSLEPHVERVAYRLRAPRSRAVPSELRIPVPGLFLRRGRGRACPVVVTRLETTSFRLQDVTGRLREPPSRTAWRERAA